MIFFRKRRKEKANDSNDNYFEELEKKENTLFNKPIDEVRVPEIILRYRKEYNGQKLKVLKDLYFDTINKQNNTDRLKATSEYIQYSTLALSLTEPLIEHEKLNRGYRGFNLSLPALNFTPDYFALNGIKGQLANIKDILYFFAELKSDRWIIDRAYVILETRSKVFEYIKRNNSITNKEFEETFKEEFKIISYSILSSLEDYGFLKSEKRKGRFKLYELA